VVRASLGCSSGASARVADGPQPCNSFEIRPVGPSVLHAFNSSSTAAISPGNGSGAGRFAGPPQMGGDLRLYALGSAVTDSPNPGAPEIGPRGDLTLQPSPPVGGAAGIARRI
jgi:hypothetical protein